MPKSEQTDDQGGVPIRVGDPVHDFPEGVPVVVPPEDVSESSDSGSKSGQKATPQKKEG